jgi:hypothetical protein
MGYESLEALVELAPRQHDSAATFQALQAYVCADSGDLPFVGPAGVWLAQHHHVTYLDIYNRHVATSSDLAGVPSFQA